MLRNRLTYLGILLGAGIFFLCFNGYLSLYVLRIAAALPFVSLLISLPGMLGVRLELIPAVTRARKSAAVSLRVVISHRLPVASPRVRATLTVENTLTGEVQRERLEFSAARTPTVLTYPLTSPTCGEVRLSLSKAWVTDYMGLFALPLRGADKERRSVLFYPAVYRPHLTVTQTALTAGEGERYSQSKPGDDPAEIFAFREYREGDRLARVHWKLSQRMGELQVKELGLPVSDRVCFLLEPTGSGAETDALLDAFATLSGFLSEREAPHRVGFAAAGDPELTLLEVASPEDAAPALEALLTAGARGDPLPLPRPGQLPPGAAHVLYLCRAPREPMLAALRSQLPEARITVLMTADPKRSPAPSSAGAELVAVTPESLPDCLNGLVL